MSYIVGQDEPPQESDKPPPAMDSAARRVSTPRLVLREIQRCMAGMDTPNFIRGSGIRRCSFNLQTIRAKG